MDELSVPLLATKLTIPPRRENLVQRPRLVRKLDQALRPGRRLILISARAGMGKTTLLGDWLHLQELPAAWLSLDANDDEPRRFLAYLLAAFGRLGLSPGQAIQHQLEGQAGLDVEALLSGLITQIDPGAATSLLVLDDYHHIQDRRIHDGLAFLIERLPPAVHLALITRVDPPLALARLRGRGQLVEIRGPDLSFTPQEAAQFLIEVMGLDLSSEAVSALEQRTEGWIVGLQMAALSLRGRGRDRDQAAAFIDAFGGTNRFILDYLLEEVLHRQPPAVQEFLLRTSILARMSAGLCDALLGDASPGDASPGDSEPAAGDGQAILADLERANLFVVPLDDQRQWYRYHHLFADLLKSTLKQQKSAAAVRDLHLRASRWHHDQGTLEEAMTHAMASGDYQWAAEILDQHFVTMFSRSEVPVLLGWMDDLPAEIVSRQPWVDVYRAYTLALGGKSGEAIPLLDQVERRLDVGTPRRLELAGHIAAIRAYIANLRGDVERVIDQAALAGKYLGQEHLIARAMAAYALADTYFAADELPAAGLALEEVLRSGRQAGRLLMIVPALCDLSAVHIAQGQLHLAKRRLDEAWDWLVKQDGLETRLRCAYEFGLANLLREWNDLDAAHEHVQAGLARRRRHGGYLVVGDLALMRVLQARGDTQGALEALQTAQEYMQTYHFQLSTRTDFEAARVVQWLAAGDVGLAAHWAGHLRLESEVQALALARLYLAQDRPQDAQRLLERQQPLAAAGGRNGRLIEIQALLALARQAQGQLAEADQALSRALSLARTEGAMRLFLDLGQPLYTLLQRAAGKPGLAATSQPGRRYEADLLTAFAREAEARAQSRPAEPTYSSLTERELEVVRLLAEGLSNKEMADRLVVAPSTIKQHLKNIYDKLDVHSRVQAVERGRQLDLL